MKNGLHNRCLKLRACGMHAARQNALALARRSLTMRYVDNEGGTTENDLGRSEGWAMDAKSKLSAKGVELLGIMCAIVAFGMGCQSDRHNSESMATPELGSDWTPFVEMARQSPCVDIRNRLFVIDHVLVFWDRQGQCPDYSYGETLYGQTVNDMLCEFHDSIAGPVKDCPVPSYQEMFEIMIGHLDAPDLGLGPGHTVQQLPF